MGVSTRAWKTKKSGGISDYDAGKQTKGRKRNIDVDTLGLMVGLIVHCANIQNRDRASSDLLKMVPHSWP